LARCSHAGLSLVAQNEEAPRIQLARPVKCGWIWGYRDDPSIRPFLWGFISVSRSPHSLSADFCFLGTRTLRILTEGGSPGGIVDSWSSEDQTTLVLEDHRNSRTDISFAETPDPSMHTRAD
jgi:hypothetical protein